MFWPPNNGFLMRFAALLLAPPMWTKRYIGSKPPYARDFVCLRAICSARRSESEMQPKDLIPTQATPRIQIKIMLMTRSDGTPTFITPLLRLDLIEQSRFTPRCVLSLRFTTAPHALLSSTILFARTSLRFCTRVLSHPRLLPLQPARRFVSTADRFSNRRWRL